MDKKALDRLRLLAGNEVAEVTESANVKNMYQIIEGLESSMLEESPEDRARYDAADGTGKKVSVKKAPWEKDEKVEESDEEDLDEAEELDEEDQVEEAAKPDFADIDDDGDKEETAKKAADDKEEMTETELMREWSNSVYKQYDDRGHYQEQPDGETVDLSLRRYLNADPMKVQIEESIKPSDLAKAYRDFKGK